MDACDDTAEAVEQAAYLEGDGLASVDCVKDSDGNIILGNAMLWKGIAGIWREWDESSTRNGKAP